MKPEVLVNDLLLKLEPEWGSKKIESLKLIHAIGDAERKERIEKIISISAKKLINDNLLNNHVLLPPSVQKACEGKGHVLAGTVCYGIKQDKSYRELYPLYLDYEDVKNHMLITGLSGAGKTTLAYNLLIELAQKKNGSKRCIVFDWDRTWRNLLSLDKEKYPFVEDIRVYTIGRNDIAPFS